MLLREFHSRKRKRKIQEINCLRSKLHYPMMRHWLKCKLKEDDWTILLQCCLPQPAKQIQSYVTQTNWEPLPPHYAVLGWTKGGIFKSCPRVPKLRICLWISNELQIEQAWMNSTQPQTEANSLYLFVCIYNFIFFSIFHFLCGPFTIKSF